MCSMSTAASSPTSASSLNSQRLWKTNDNTGVYLWSFYPTETLSAQYHITIQRIVLLPYYKEGLVEAGCDEAGRGCLAGSVYAAAVILPPDYYNDLLNDSKQLTARQRYKLREEIERDAIAWALGIVTAQEIDAMNILRASITAMHRAIDALTVRPQHLIIDGNRFYPYHDIPHQTIVKGDAKYLSIAAASILAKTYRDDYMRALHDEYPYYGWDHNAGYPTKEHRQGIETHGISPYHRKSFQLLPQAVQLEIPFGDM